MMSDTDGPKSPAAAQPLALAAAAAQKVDIAATTQSRPNMAQQQRQKQQWNTKNLGLRLGADAASGAAAASMVAPLISIIDRSIMENASGRSTLLSSLKTSLLTLLLRPHRIVFAKPFALIFMTYGGTYLMANMLDTATSTVRNKPATLVTSGTAKFAVSSGTNTSLGIYKDQVFARMFGPPGAPPRPVPLPSYLLFGLRDAVTIFASFNLPMLLGPYLGARLPEAVQKKMSGQTLAQFSAPALAQLVTTPMHLLGLDLFNRPCCVEGRPTMSERLKLVRSNWAISVAARVCRIVPAFGFGGVVNFKVRRHFMEKLA